MTEWHVYVVRAGDGRLYTGIATDVDRRLVEHAAGARGAKSLRGKGPLELVLRKPIGSRALALKVEHRVKRLSKPHKEALVRDDPDTTRLLEMLDLMGDR